MAKSRSGSLLFPFLRGEGQGQLWNWLADSPREESTMPGPGREINVVAQFIGQLQVKTKRAA